MNRTTSRRLRALGWFAAITLAAASFARAGTPALIHYQGRLVDTNKNPRNGTYSMTFSIWDTGPGSGGSQLWTETQPSVAVSNGVFSTQLGSVTPIPTSVFAGATTYLQVQIGAETGSTRQRLLASPYAERAATADNLDPGDNDYIQNTASLQSGAQFNVSSGTVTGPLKVGGVLTVGSGNVTVTTAGGLLDATKLTGAVPTSSLNGLYSGLTAGNLAPGDTDYIQSRDTLQSGATFYVSKGTVFGTFVASGPVTLGSTPGTGDVTVLGNLNVTGAGPHIFTGDVRVNGGDLLDPSGTSRITLGSPIALNADLSGASGTAVSISTSVRFDGPTNGDNYVAFPFTAGGTISAKQLVIVSGANTVTAAAATSSTAVIGIAVTPATSGNTVWVATSGIVSGVVAGGTVSVGNRICTTTTAGRGVSCTTSGAIIGKALSGASSGGTFTVVMPAN